jgi:hypothetical protein
VSRQPADLDRILTLPDGRSYTLRFSARAQGALQDFYQLPSLAQTMGKVGEMFKSGDVGIGDMVEVVFAMLRTHHRDVPRDDVLGWFDDFGADAVFGQAVIDTVQAAMPPATPAAESGEGSANGHPPRRTRSTTTSKTVAH